MDYWCYTGGIFRLRELIEEYKEAITADFRSHYNLSIFDAGKTYSYVEALYLTKALLKQSDSRLGAEMRGWEYPVSYESMVLMDLFDLLHIINSKKKPKPYKRPYSTEDNNRTRMGRAEIKLTAVDKIRKMREGKVKPLQSQSITTKEQ